MGPPLAYPVPDASRRCHHSRNRAISPVSRDLQRHESGEPHPGTVAPSGRSSACQTARTVDPDDPVPLDGRPRPAPAPRPPRASRPGARCARPSAPRTDPRGTRRRPLNMLVHSVAVERLPGPRVPLEQVAGRPRGRGVIRLEPPFHPVGPASRWRSGSCARRPSRGRRRPARPRWPASPRSPRPSPVPRPGSRAGRCRPTVGEPGGRGDRGVRIAAGPDVGDGDRIRRRERVGEGGQQCGRPMVRQRLVDRPDATTRLALPDGLDGRADGRRVVAVVVVDDHAGGLALALEAPSDAVERASRPATMAAARHRRADVRPR